MQIATQPLQAHYRIQHLCLHTLRADCNRSCLPCPSLVYPLPPHAPCRLQPGSDWTTGKNCTPLPPHAPCRLQLRWTWRAGCMCSLCLHTLRADCNVRHFYNVIKKFPFASTRSVQIATVARLGLRIRPAWLCLHTLRADCNQSLLSVVSISRRLCLHTLRADCNNRR